MARKQIALFFWLALVLPPCVAVAAETNTFTDTQGRTTLYRYSLKAEWDPEIPRGVRIFFHGNNSVTQQQVIDSFFPSIERDSFRRGLIPIVMASPETRDPPQEDTRQWKQPDELLLHELLQSQLQGAIAIDFERVFFDGASQGACFIHGFLPDYGENYGGGFYGGCGCYNSPDALWDPSDEFRDSFKVFVHTTTDDFLYETSQEGYAYYKHTIGLQTRGDLEREGAHCTANNLVRDSALDWLTGAASIAEDVNYPHWERVFVGDNIVGVTADSSGAVYLIQRNTDGSSLVSSSPDAGSSWDTGATLPILADDIDVAGGALFVSSGPRLYRSVDNGLSFSELDSQGTFSTVVTDFQSNLYRRGAFISKSENLGQSWQLLGGATEAPYSPGNSIFLNADPIIVDDPQLITIVPGDFRSLTKGAIGSVQGDDWVTLGAIPNGTLSNAAWNGSILWGLSREVAFPYAVSLYQSSDRGQSWTKSVLPEAYDEYFGFNTRISILDENSFVLHGDFNSSWITRDSGNSWVRAYGGRTFGIAKVAIDPSGGAVYATDGQSLFTLREDSDFDGVADRKDNCPLDANGSQTNSDGAEDGGDACDAFPLNAAASVDADRDDLPDKWNSDCDVTCQNSSSLTLDDDPTEHVDIDGDGFTNTEEIAAGSDPLDAASSPTETGLNIILIKAAIDAAK